MRSFTSHRRTRSKREHTFSRAMTSERIFKRDVNERSNFSYIARARPSLVIGNPVCVSPRQHSKQEDIHTGEGNTELTTKAHNKLELERESRRLQETSCGSQRENLAVVDRRHSLRPYRTRAHARPDCDIERRNPFSIPHFWPHFMAAGRSRDLSVTVNERAHKSRPLFACNLPPIVLAAEISK